MGRISLYALLFLNSFLYCQDVDRLDYPFLYHVTLKCSVTYNENGKLYSYSYAITNDANNIGTITTICLDISRGTNSVEYDTIGLAFYPKLTKIYFQRHYPRLKTRIVAIGFPVLPNEDWYGTIGNNYSEAEISTDSLGIIPGRTVNTIILASKALPGIRNIRLEPVFWDDYFFSSIEDTSANALTSHQMDSIRAAVNFYGRTTGPTAPPLNFVPIIWIDTLISYKHQAVTLSWLRDRKETQKDEDDEEKEDGVVAKLDKRLEKARAELLKGDSINARKELEKFVKKVEKLYKESDKEEDKNKPEKVVITSEGFALLKYNAEYLIDRLPKKEKGGKDNDDKDHH